MSSHRSFQVHRRVRRRSRRRLPARLLAGLAALLTVVGTWSAKSPAQEAEEVVAPDSAEQAGPDRGPAHQPPVDAPVVDGFRPPARPYGPGNRGLEYDTDLGTPVRASAGGEVVFAGAVAGALHVTVRHPDGVRTSYSHLDGVAVVVGQQVAAGQALGVAGDRLHFGARRGDAYFDPATLFGGATRVEVELIPFEVPPGSTIDQERAALLTTTFDGGGGLGIDLPDLPDLGDAASWTLRRAGLWSHYRQALPAARGLVAGAAIVDRLATSEPCSDEPPPVRPVAGDDHLAILVGGLGSSLTQQIAETVGLPVETIERHWRAKRARPR